MFNDLNDSGNHAPLPNLVASSMKRAKKAVECKSLPRPAIFPTNDDWAEFWVKHNGMTLPPYTPELLSLRNWFCNQKNRWRKGETRPEYQAELLVRGIDFNKYSANNTGRIVRSDDRPFVAQMIDHHKKTGSFNLDKASPEALLDWQERLLARFFLDGRSTRLIEIEAKLPGLDYATWMRPNESGDFKELTEWMVKARRFEQACKKTPAFRGDLHPRMAADLQVWARQQQFLASSKKLTGRKMAVLKDLHILKNKTQRRVNQQREKQLAIERKQAGSSNLRGGNERRLDTFLGTCLYVRKIVQESSDIAIMTEFCISPDTLLLIKNIVEEDVEGLFDEPVNIGQINLCRDVYHTAQANSEDDFSSFNDYHYALGFASKVFSSQKIQLFKNVYKLWKKMKSLDLQQDLVSIDDYSGEAS